MSVVPRLGAAVLTAAMLVAVGCGGGDTAEKNDYVDAVNEVTLALQSSITQISSQGAAPSSPEQASALFDTVASRLHEAATEMEGISPPEEVASLHDQMVDDLDTLADEATGAANDVKAGGPASVSGTAAQFLAEATRLSTEIDTTISRINTELQG